MAKHAYVIAYNIGIKYSEVHLAQTAPCWLLLFDWGQMQSLDDRRLHRALRFARPKKKKKKKGLEIIAYVT